MNNHWRIVKEILADALETSHDGRAALLDERCEGDADLRRAVESLLAREDETRSFLEEPALIDHAVVSAACATNAGDRDSRVDRQVGQYHLIRRIGSGGVGTVYEAEQHKPHRHVAVKLLQPAAAGDVARKRFIREGEVLANLRHPGIAHVYETGIHEEHGEATPYIAMELVPEARTLIAFADAQELTIDARVALMLDICDAVEHAHACGIVHRDLKPANILVDGAGRAKVIDFGVARMLGVDPHAEHTLHTSAGDIIGTLSYMSPEQCGGDPDRVDERSDVYSLGVTLFRLLAGRVPIELAGVPIDRALELIREHPPMRLSRIAPHLPDDLDAITSMALEKDPARRYDSVASFAADLRRYLDHEPVIARPPSIFYQTKLFARRHRALVTSAVLIVVVLSAASIVSLTFAVMARRAADAETWQRSITERVNEHLEDMLTLPDPHLGGADTTVIQMLDRMVAKLDAATDEPAEVEAPVRASIGATYLALGRNDAADTQLRRARLLFVSFDPMHPRLPSVLNELGMVANLRNDDIAAERYFRDAIAVRRAGTSDRDLNLTALLGNLAGVMIRQNRFAEAEPLIREALDLRKREFGPTDISVIAGLRQLARLKTALNEYDEAETLLVEAQTAAQDTLNHDHPILAAIASERGQVALGNGDTGRAIEQFNHAWAQVSQSRTPGSADWNYTLANLTDCLIGAGDLETARIVITEAIEQLRSKVGDDDPRTREAVELLDSLRTGG